jgi:molybdopterin synthase catalytic subunit
MFKIVSTPIETHLEEIELRHESRGAVITFEGRVRNHNNGKTVTRLDYEAYDDLARTEAERIFEEAKEKYEIDATASLHRVGNLRPGELSFWVGTSSGHRDAAFKGCRYVVDEIKRRVPVWKKEHYQDGSVKRINSPSSETS